MLKWAPLLCGLVFLLSCDQNSSENIFAEAIVNIHNQVDSLAADSVYPYLKRAQKILESNTQLQDSLRAQNDYYLGLHFRKKGKLDSAAHYFQNATYFVGDRVDKLREFNYFYLAWSSNSRVNNYADCIAMAQRLQAKINADDSIQRQFLYYPYFYKADAYYFLKEYDSALVNSQRATKISWLGNDSLKLVPDLIRQSQIQYALSNKRETFRILDSLISMTDKLTPDHKRMIFGNYGVYSYYNGDYRKAIDYYQQGVNAIKQTRDTLAGRKLSELAIAYANLAEASLELKQYNKAQDYLDSIKMIGINKIPERLQKSVLKYQIRLSAETEENMTPTLRLIDTLFNFKEDAYKDKLNDELFALTKSYKEREKLALEKQQADIDNLKLQNRLLFVLFGSLVIVLFGFLFYRQRKIRFERQALQMQQRLLRSQMNPHFTFNTLYAIQNTLQKNPKEATDYLMKFSRLLRSILENSTQNYVALEKELNSLRRYLELQQFRTNKAFDYVIKLDGIEDEDLIFIPPMLLQPFVENSIEHGFKGIDYQGSIEIILVLRDKFIDCTITDNGIGLRNDAASNESSQSIKLISDFLQKATKNELKITNRKTTNGTTKGSIVRFTIPHTLAEYD